MSASFELELGGLGFRIVLPPGVNPDPLLARYRPFLGASVHDWTVKVVLDASVGNTSSIRHDGALTRFQIVNHRGWLDLHTAQVVVSALSSAEAHLHSALTRTIVYGCIQTLPRRGMGLLIHGAGIVIHGKGHIFFGASGQGKSTVTRLAGGVGTVLSDENVIVRFTPEGPVLVSTPFWGFGTPVEETQALNSEPVPLVALYSLVHSPTHTLRRLSRSQAIMALLSSEKVATERVDSAEPWLETAGRLAAEVPLYELAFRPTVDLWPFLEAQLGAFG